ncbi:reverse transcriptase domain, reverse transcriptase zinc-binding domain protein, partial [Tanacetum coccineum]
MALIGEEIDGVGVEFTSSLGGLRDGKDIIFWVGRWVDDRRLFDRFSSLYHLDRRKESIVWEKGSWDNNVWCWEWDWIREIRGRVSKEFEDLLGVLQNVVIHNNCKDNWRWSLGEDGNFAVKDLSRMVEEKILHADSGGQETIWNNLVPKKVNIFVWRALKGRLPVRDELDRKGIDLDSVLCPSCNNGVETCAHCLTTCGLAMSVWDSIFKWWKVGDVNVYSIDEFFSPKGNVNVPTFLSRVWQAVIWSTGYFIWKERNARVFGNKVTTENFFLRGQLDFSVRITAAAAFNLYIKDAILKGFLEQVPRDSIRSTNVEVVQHGACLGLGLAALGTADEDIYDEIKSVLYTDSVVAGEAS